jgi:type VI secretion system protein VasI
MMVGLLTPQSVKGIKPTEERLQCHDKLAEGNGGAREVVDLPPNGVGDWEVETEVSPIDDSTNVYLYLKASEPVAGMFGQDTYPYLTVRCRENDTDLYISWEQFLGSGGTAVLIRFDKEKARETRWGTSTDGKAVFSPNPIAHIKEMLEHDQLIVRTTPFSESPVTASFNIRGLASVIGQLQAACHWK